MSSAIEVDLPSATGDPEEPACPRALIAARAVRCLFAARLAADVESDAELLEAVHKDRAKVTRFGVRKRTANAPRNFAAHNREIESSLPRTSAPADRNKERHWARGAVFMGGFASKLALPCLFA
jgi:hypothetical protein